MASKRALHFEMRNSSVMLVVLPVSGTGRSASPALSFPCCGSHLFGCCPTFWRRRCCWCCVCACVCVCVCVLDDVLLVLLLLMHLHFHIQLLIEGRAQCSLLKALCSTQTHCPMRLRVFCDRVHAGGQTTAVIRVMRAFCCEEVRVGSARGVVVLGGVCCFISRYAERHVMVLVTVLRCKRYVEMSCSVLQCAGREIKLILQRQTQRARPRFSPICCTTAATIHDLMCLLQRVVVYCSFPPTCCAAAITLTCCAAIPRPLALLSHPCAFSTSFAAAAMIRTLMCLALLSLHSHATATSTGVMGWVCRCSCGALNAVRGDER
mmetsp:Transcript_58127/g.85185  ORF Transcript_58127/g.85185 Transcript_58127/m.85185 type:complete len:321 (+) Transcript_58127:266-1228(+)